VLKFRHSDSEHGSGEMMVFAEETGAGEQGIRRSGPAN
jgi:hypothetical protein